MLARLAHFILWVGGWTPVGTGPDEPKAVIVAAPHTSNWDAFWALVYKVAVGLDVKFFAKHSAFWFPLGTILRALGGVALDRRCAGTAVDQAIEMFRTEESFYFGLAPEGTRKKTSGWKTGFYRIAIGADVPVYLGFLDFRTKRVGIGPHFKLSGDQEVDLEICRKFYAGIDSRRPEQASPITFQSGAKP